MGVDYGAIAGYGVEIKKEMLTEEAQQLMEDNDYGIWDLFYEEVDYEIDSAGCHYSGDLYYYFLIEDPWKADVEEEITIFNETGLLKEPITKEDLEWVCEVVVS